MVLRITTLIAAVLFAAPAVFAQEDVTLEPSKDNTLYEDDSGALSNGAGEYFFVGRTGQSTLRRALLEFDMENAVPDSAVVNDVALRLRVSMVPPGAGTVTISLHRLTSDWGEGTSDAQAPGGTGTSATADDATWIHTFHDTSFWDAEGGDFIQDASARVEVSGVGEYTVSSEGLTADVRGWIADPSTNFGWILIGDESTNQTARRFDSRENGSAQNRPQLTITYSTGVATERPDLPSTLRIAGNYPNPFAASTTIHYDVERAQWISLRLYDVLGREVRELVRGYQAAGHHEIAVSSKGLPAGTYVYCFDGGECGRMLLVP